MPLAGPQDLLVALAFNGKRKSPATRPRCRIRVVAQEPGHSPDQYLAPARHPTRLDTNRLRTLARRNLQHPTPQNPKAHAREVICRRRHTHQLPGAPLPTEQQQCRRHRGWLADRTRDTHTGRTPIAVAPVTSGRVCLRARGVRDRPIRTRRECRGHPTARVPRRHGNKSPDADENAPESRHKVSRARAGPTVR